MTSFLKGDWVIYILFWLLLKILVLRCHQSCQKPSVFIDLDLLIFFIFLHSHCLYSCNYPHYLMHSVLYLRIAYIGCSCQLYKWQLVCLNTQPSVYGTPVVNWSSFIGFACFNDYPCRLYNRLWSTLSVFRYERCVVQSPAATVSSSDL